jgi:hypothetical protein
LAFVFILESVSNSSTINTLVFVTPFSKSLSEASTLIDPNVVSATFITSPSFSLKLNISFDSP